VIGWLTWITVEPRYWFPGAYAEQGPSGDKGPRGDSGPSGKAIRSVFGEAPVQRCVRHKERNVLDHLPERDRPLVKTRLRKAWAEPDQTRALDQLRLLAGSSTAPTPAPLARCGKEWKKRSRSAGSASAAT